MTDDENQTNDEFKATFTLEIRVLGDNGKRQTTSAAVHIRVPELIPHSEVTVLMHKHLKAFKDELERWEGPPV